MLGFRFILAALPALALAKSADVTTSLFGLNSEIDYVASVMNVDQSATTFQIGCNSGPSCPAGFSATMTEGPSTAVVLAASSVSGVKVELTMNCQLTGSTAAGCGVTIIEAGPGFSISTAVTTALSGTDLIYAAVTITAGAQKLAAFSSTATAVAAATLTSQTASGASATGSQASSTAGASSATSASSTVSTASAGAPSFSLSGNMMLFSVLFALVGASTLSVL